MEPDSVLNLFDSLWFYALQTPKTLTPSTHHQPTPPTHLTVNTKPKTDQPIITSPKITNDISSPNSVLLIKPHLETILSDPETTPTTPQFKKHRPTILKKTKRALSKSMSQLELEELKGFMDLGFVFSEEDKVDSHLLEILPGLGEGKKEDGVGQRARPYLSEAWEEMERKRTLAAERRPLMVSWRVAAAAGVGNEIDMKDSLKWWAHTVASAVR